MLKNGQIYFCGAYNVRLLKYVRSFFNILHEGVTNNIIISHKKIEKRVRKDIFQIFVNCGEK